MYADTDLAEHRHNYSNLGLLLVCLSIKYHYNKKYNSVTTYNEILNRYIVNKIGLKTFSIRIPSNAKYNDDVTRYKNATPAGGYYISCNELRMFGDWLYKLCNGNNDVNELINKYGIEFYHNGIIEHGGSISPTLDHNKLTSTSHLSIHLNENIIISIMSNHNDDTDKLYHAMMYCK
jgi:hypothetical protein